MHPEFMHSKLLQSAKKFKKINNVIVKTFWRCHVSLIKFILVKVLWKYHYFITGSGVTTIFFYKELDQKFGNRKYPCLTVVQYRDWVKFVIPNLGWMFPIQSYSTLLNSGFTASTVSDLLRENQLASKNTSHLI